MSRMMGNPIIPDRDVIVIHKQNYIAAGIGNTGILGQRATQWLEPEHPDMLR